MTLVQNNGDRPGHPLSTGVSGLAAAASQAGKALPQIATLAAQGYVTREIANQMLMGLAMTPALDWLQKVGGAIAEDTLQRAVYDSRAAAEPAHRLLGVLETIERQMDGLIARLRRDYMWKPRRIWTPRRHWRVEPALMATELQRLAGQMWFAMNECQFVSDQVLQKYHPLGRIVVVRLSGTAPRLEDGQCLFPIAATTYHSEHEKMRDIRRRLERLAIHLRKYAHDARAVVQAESREGGAEFTASVVWAEAATFDSKALGVMATCGALAALVAQEAQLQLQWSDRNIFETDQP